VATTAERVAQHVYLVDGGAKREVLVELMRNPDLSRAIVFTRTKRGADKVAQHLEAAGVGAEAIHGNKSQSQRERALDGFRRGRTRVLVATDIAARGIDVDGVSHVVNYELPETPEAYVHRIGRTARAGASGQAISLCENGERQLLRAIEKLTRQSLPVTDRRSAEARQDESAGRPNGKSSRGGLQPKRNGSARPRRDASRSDTKPTGARPTGAIARPEKREEASGGFRSRPRRSQRREARATS
jgi:ATP-dependent RNA helicase RhlE